MRAKIIWSIPLILIYGVCLVWALSYLLMPEIKPISSEIEGGVADLSTNGFLTVLTTQDAKKYQITSYNWEGQQQWRTFIPYASNQTGWLQSDNTGWYSADYMRYHTVLGREPAKYNRSHADILFRFSPTGHYVGIIHKVNNGLAISLFEGATCQWQRTIPLSFIGPISGKEDIDLLLNDKGSILLYAPGPSLRPVALVGQHTMDTTQLVANLESFIQAYVRTIPKPKGASPRNWFQPGIIASSPYRQFLLREEKTTITMCNSSGRVIARLKSYEFHFNSPVDGMPSMFQINFKYGGPKDYEYDNDKVVDPFYFSPDGHHLLVPGGLLEF